MERLRILRATPEGRKAREAISGEVAAKLAAIVEGAAPFRDGRARRRFGPDLRWWACRCIMDRDAPLRRARRMGRADAAPPGPVDRRGGTPGPLPRETREVLGRLLEQVDEARAAVGRTLVALASLESTAYGALHPFLDRPGPAAVGTRIPPDPARGGDPRAAWLGELDRAHRRLLRLGRGVEAGRSAVKGRSGPRPRVLHRAAIHGLAQLWLDLTGKRPTRRNDAAGTRAGPFRDFVRAAMALAWSGAGGFDGLIDEVCSQLGSADDPR